jgi:hypothetical protein
VLLWVAAIASAAALLALAYILGSDVRGRSAAMVATIEARKAVATAMIAATERMNATPRTQSALGTDVFSALLPLTAPPTNGQKTQPVSSPTAR